MPWLPPTADEQKVLCDLCSWVTAQAYVGPIHAKRDAAVWWPKPYENQGKEGHAWCPRCASAASTRANQSYESKSIDVDYVMKVGWEQPTALAVPGDTAANTNRGDCGPPMAAPPPGTSSSSRTDPGRVPPTKPPPPPLLTTEERLAALETEVFQLRHSVAKLLVERRSSGAATG